MNSPNLKSSVLLVALVMLVATSVSVGAVLLDHSLSRHQRSQPPIEKLFQGGVVVFFHDNVPESRVKEVVSSPRSKIVFEAPELHMVVIRFDPPLSTIYEADRVASDLERLPEVKSAGP